MESPERGKPVVGIAMEIPVSDGSMSCSPPNVPNWLRRRLSESKAASLCTVEEIEANLRDVVLRRQALIPLQIVARCWILGSASNSSSWDDIDHFLKRVSSSRRKNTPRKTLSGREAKNTGFSGQAGNSPVSFSRYQVGVVLCAYMILGHPEAVISGRGDRETALPKSAEKFVLELDLLIKILLNWPLDVPNEKNDDSSVLCRTFSIQLSAFDSAWCSFLNSFVVLKSKDARSIEEDLVRAACRLELSMIQTCKMTPEGVNGPLSHDMKLSRNRYLKIKNF